MALAIAAFNCLNLNCGAENQFELEVSPPNFMAEVMSDGDAIETHDVSCDECNSEYKIETVNGMGGLWATLEGTDIAIELQHESDFNDSSDYEDYLSKYEPEKLPIAVFRTAISELSSLLFRHGTPGSSTLNRMVFSQLISTMEAYLSDKILNLADNVPEVKHRLVRSADFIDGIHLTPKEMLLDPVVAEKKFRTALQWILFHDLEKVEKLFKIALRGPFYPEVVSLKADLLDAVKLRHDCVHRNGRSVKGLPGEFSRPKVEQLAENVKALVESIDHLSQTKFP